jgi:hypothetical protein
MEKTFAATVKSRDGVWARALDAFRRDLEKRVAEFVKQLPLQVRAAPFVPPDAPSVPDTLTTRQLINREIVSVKSIGFTGADGRPHTLNPGQFEISAPAPRPTREPRRIAVDGEIKSGTIHLQIAGILAGYYPEPLRVSILAALCGASMGGSFRARLSEVRSAGLLDDPARGFVRATEKCAHEYLGKFQAPSTTEEVLAVWEPKWNKVHRDIMRFLVEHGGEAVSREELAQAAGMTMGGSFSARLSEVRSSGLLSEPGRGMVAANKEALFLNGDSTRAREA